jgi:hypothetical protein
MSATRERRLSSVVVAGAVGGPVTSKVSVSTTAKGFALEEAGSHAVDTGHGAGEVP